MKTLKNFFECYFHQNEGYDSLDEIVENLKKTEDDIYRLQLITDLNLIIQTKGYRLASKIIDEYGGRILDLDKTEKIINFLYDRLTGKPSKIKPEDFKKKVKVVLCPFCCPDQENPKMIILIQKANIIEKNIQIYICKDCKHVWLTDDIRIDNAQDYKQYMKTLGLKGLWNELSDVDIL